MIKSFGKYFKKQIQNYSIVPFLSDPDIIVVIPVYREPHLIHTLNSIAKCEFGKNRIAVILVFNASVLDSPLIIEEQKESIQSTRNYVQNHQHNQISYHIVEAFDLSRKYYGVGAARKIGMDIAAKYFGEKEEYDGVIACLDADVEIDSDYFLVLLESYSDVSRTGGVVYFEHPLKGKSYNEDVYAAIAQYELHLRYYLQALKFTGFPYAFHTVGSCISVRASAYVRAGGMNRKQAGEDFYFVHKVVPQGGFSEIDGTTVYPSPRISDRVPFGTGPTIKKITEMSGEEYQTYNFQAFLDIKELFDRRVDLFLITQDEYKKIILALPGRVRSFLVSTEFWVELNELNHNCAQVAVFEKRFFELFNAFRVVKYLNYIHEHFISKMGVYDAAMELLDRFEIDSEDVFDIVDVLHLYRKMERDK